MIRTRQIIPTALATCLIASACGAPSAPSASGLSAGSELRAETFCAVDGLDPALRHTYVMIDEKVLSKTETPADFVGLNGRIRDVVLTFADPDRALSSGTSDYRERISIHILPTDGSASYRVFSGCIPGLSPQELIDSRKQGSAVNDFFTGGVQQQIRNDSEDFIAKLVGSLQNAARSAKGPASPQTGKVNEISAFQSIRASGRVINSDLGVPRVVLVTDLSSTQLPEAEGRDKLREAAFAAGSDAALDFSRADVVVVQSNGGNENQREYIDAFLLAQHGKLVYWGNERVGALPTAPSRIARYVGTASYPNGEDTVQIRVAMDRSGRLVNSWLILRGRPDKSVPMTGSALCETPQTCVIRSDEGGFSQFWSLSPGGEPEFHPDMPFSGLRDFEFTAGPDTLEGKLFDPSVDRIGPPGSEMDSIKLDARLQADANF
ncbi:hypothetical protein ACQKH5_03415 [Hyphomonas sp. NPDC076900]|uniref:hypothetical protein n=1 Tax=unclassified Hyphomonas TaxID=2630699 RepID=UPI003D0674AD